MDDVNHSPQESATSPSAAPAADASRSRRLLFLLPVLVFLPAIVAYLLASTQQEKFQAQAEIAHTIVNPSFGTTDRLLATQEVRAQSRGLAEAVSQRFGIDTNEFVADLTVEPIVTGINEDSTALDVTYRHPDGELAEQAVQAYVDEYLASAEVVVDVPGLDGTANEIEKLQERRNELLAEIGAAREGGDLDLANELNDDYEFVVSDLGVQVSLFNSLRPNTPVVVAEQLGTTWLNPDPVEPQPIRAGALGLVAGVSIASAALLFARRPRSS